MLAHRMLESMPAAEVTGGKSGQDVCMCASQITAACPEDGVGIGREWGLCLPDDSRWDRAGVGVVLTR